MVGLDTIIALATTTFIVEKKNLYELHPMDKKKSLMILSMIDKYF